MSVEQLNLDWEKVGGLIPAIIQDHKTEQVLMMGYMNIEAITKTIETGKVTFWSRTQNKLWMKGETSGNILSLISLHVDCDRDTLLIRANPTGPTCHTGSTSCFATTQKSPATFLQELGDIIRDRHMAMPDGSYTTELFRAGKARIAQKVGEEGVEVAIAHMADDKEGLVGEVADLFYHSLVLLEDAGLTLQDVTAMLEKRHKK